MNMIKVNVDGTDQLMTLPAFLALAATENQMNNQELTEGAVPLPPGSTVYNNETNKLNLITPTGREEVTSTAVVVAADPTATKEGKESKEAGGRKEDDKKDSKDVKDSKK